MRMIGDYELLAELGRGAMGRVYRARDTRLNREVALKVLWPQLAEQPKAVARFEREARAMAQVQHPNVVKVFDIGAVAGCHYLAMEYVAGGSLRELLKQPLPVDKALRYFKQILSGLAAAHEQGVLHRDLKPGNVLLEQETDTVKLADFGLARIIEDETSLTQSGEMLGTVEYMAPELGRGESSSRQSDLYAVGVILYRLLTGRLPFTGVTSMAVLEAHERGTYSLATAIAAKLPPQADAVLARLLAGEPVNRYADCQAVLIDLQCWERGEEIPLVLVAADEPSAHESERYRVPGWKRVWARVVSWHRYQWLEVFNRTELTLLRIRNEVGVAERELGRARRRLEEASQLRNRPPMPEDAPRLEQKVAMARRECELCASQVAELRYTADLTLARRRRAKLEMSVLGILSAGGRRLGERFLAAVKLFGPGLLLIAGIFFLTSSSSLFPPRVTRPAIANSRSRSASSAAGSQEARQTRPDPEAEPTPDPDSATAVPAFNPRDWTRKAPMLTARSSFGAVVVDGKVYVLGGSAREPFPKTVERYDPLSNRWESWGTIPENKSTFARAFAWAGKIYYVDNSIIQEYDPQTRMNRHITTLPVRRGYALAVVGNELYIIGGAQGFDSFNVCDVDVVNLETGVRRAAAPLNMARVGAVVAVLAGKIYVIGGMHQQDETEPHRMLDSIERYDPATNRWEMMRSLNLNGTSAFWDWNAVPLNGKIYLIGDWHTEQGWSGRITAYDPQQNRWTEVARLPIERPGKRAVAVNGEILVIGGRGGGKLDIMEGFRPR